MTYDIETIVNHLNEEPFNLNIRLIEFSKLNELDTLHSVLASTDKNTFANHNDFRNNEQLVQSKIIPFLSTISYPHLPNEEEAMENFIRNIAQGEQEIVYSILHFCLENRSSLCEQIYLAPFQDPIHIPLDISMTLRSDDELNQLAKEYQELQQEFMQEYQLYSQKKKECLELEENGKMMDAKALQNEKNLLIQKLQEFERNVQNSREEDLYQHMLHVVMLLREEEEKEERLKKHMEDQHVELDENVIKLDQMKRKYETIRSSCSDGNEISMEAIMNAIRKEIADVAMVVHSDIVADKLQVEKKIQELLELRDRPTCTEDDLYEVKTKRHQIENSMKEMESQLEMERQKKSFASIQMFKKHADTSARKVKTEKQILNEKYKELEELEKEQQKFEEKKMEREAEMNARTVDLPDGTVLQGQEINAFRASCKQNQQKIIDLQGNIENVVKENASLDDILELCRSKYNQFQEFIKVQEERAGVKGYHDSQQALSKIEKESLTVNEVKGNTLQEISDIVEEMRKTLKEKRALLQPLITNLKDKRAENKALKSSYDSQKKVFEEQANELFEQRKDLENECSHLETEWNEKENAYISLCRRVEVLTSNIEKVEKEKEYIEGGCRLSDDYQRLQEMYKDKESKQAILIEELRAEERNLKANKAARLEQKEIFVQTIAILKLKLELDDRFMDLQSLDTSEPIEVM